MSRNGLLVTILIVLAIIAVLIWIILHLDVSAKNMVFATPALVALRKRNPFIEV